MASNPVCSVSNDMNKLQVKSKNKVNKDKSNTMPSKSDDLLKSVLDSLRCPLCKDFLQMPVVMCSSGHNVCDNCCSKTPPKPVCLVCKSEITTQRNFAIEKIMEQMFSACLNASFGCTFKAPEENLKLHFKGCEFRPLLCPLGITHKSCLWTGSLKNFKAHFKQEHPKNVIAKVAFESVADLSKNNEDLQLVSALKSLFILHTKVDLETNIAYWLIQHLGDSDKIDNWTCEFHFYLSKSVKSLKFVDTCKSWEAEVQTLYKEGDCVGVPLNVLRHFLSPNKQLTYKFEIKPKNNKTA